MRKFLIITYYWPPSGGSGVQRWVKFCKYLPAQGWEPVVYTPENPEAPATDRSLEEDIPECATVVKRRIREIYSIYKKFSGGKAGEVNPINHQKKSFAKRVAMWVRGNFFIPDPRKGWVRPSVSFLKKYLKENPVDVIVTTGPPHSMHLIGRKLSKATGIPWVADFRDPWTKIFYFKHLSLSSMARKRHEKLEKQVLDDASVVVAVSPLVEQEFREMTGSRIELVTNGYDPEDYGQVVEQDGYFNLTHTGLFAADGNPDELWKALAEIGKDNAEFAKLLRIRLVGKTDVQIIDSIKAAGLERNLVDLGYCDHRTAVREQMNASLLILPLRKEPEYRAVLPGKVFEYIGSRRPLLGIGPADGAMGRLLSDAKAGVVCEWEDGAGIKETVLEAWRDFKGIQPWPAAGETSQFSRKSTAARMAEIFNSLTR